MSEVDKVLSVVTLPFTPFDYQKNEIDRLVKESVDRACYFWDMGAGKSMASTLHAMIYRQQTGAQILFVCPPILLRQWEKFLKVCGIACKVYAGTPAQRKKITFDTETVAFITNIEILKRDFDRFSDAFVRRKWMVVVDEATSIKNYSSGNFRAILQLASGQGLLLLTGTPLSTPADGYAYCKLTSPELYRSATHYENIHVGERDFFGKIVSWKNLPLLKSNMAKRASYVSTPEARPDMPRATISEIEYDLASHHLKLYRQIVDQQLVVLESGGAIDASTPQKLYFALQQVILGYAKFAQDESLVPAGFGVLDQTLEEIGDAKLVVFANYKASVRITVEHLQKKGVDVVQVNGDVSAKDKDAAIERFKTVPECRVIVLNPLSGGVGVDGLQNVAWNMLFLEIPTNAKGFWQAVKRLERPGQLKICSVRIATAVGTIQARLRKQLVENDGLINQVVPSLNDLRAALYGE
jgi:SNF2 family DNA or RNA helicase